MAIALAATDGGGKRQGCVAALAAGVRCYYAVHRQAHNLPWRADALAAMDGVGIQQGRSAVLAATLRRYHAVMWQAQNPPRMADFEQDTGFYTYILIQSNHEKYYLMGDFDMSCRMLEGSGGESFFCDGHCVPH
ncbi:MAG: hypothetical protein LBD20_05840 [Spirochaetaceae bacterium]|jgi:hypothetical protein|nr:hypothetical protein [Spirochaetaceae bacterium]